MNPKPLIRLLTALLPLLLVSCRHTNLFNSEEYEDQMADAYMVTTVSDGHNWQLTQMTYLDVTVNRSNDEVYDVTLFDGDVALARGSVNNGSTLSTTFSRPRGTEGDYRLVLTNLRGESTSRPVTIDNNTVRAVYGRSRADGEETLDVTIDTVQGMTQTYLFEDRYPIVSDCDFNDLVVRIGKSITGRTIIIRAELLAVGSYQQIALCTRLVGVKAARVRLVSEHPMKRSHAGSSSMVGNAGTTLHTGLGSKEAVLMMTNDAHWALSDDAPAGTPTRQLINATHEEEFILSTTVPSAVAEYHVTFNSLSEAQTFFSNDKTDPFIVVVNNGRTWEVHQYIYKRQQTLSEYYMGQMGVYVSNPYTWCLAVPSATMSYPVEGVPLGYGYEKRPYVEPAFPQFSTWAARRTSFETWYTHPNHELVY